MREKIFNWISRITSNYPDRVLIVTFFVTVIFISLMPRLKMEASWISLMPKDDPTVKALNKIYENYGSASSIIIAAEGDNTESLKKFAEELAPKLKNLKDYVRVVDYKIDYDFFRSHGFMLATIKNLKRERNLFKDLNLVPFLRSVNNDFEREYLEQEKLEKQEDEAVQELDGLLSFINVMNEGLQKGDKLDKKKVINVVNKLTLGEQYYLSSHKKMLLIYVQPTVSIMNIDKSIETVNEVEKVFLETLKKYPGIKKNYIGTNIIPKEDKSKGTGLTGYATEMREEMHTVEGDFGFTNLAAFILVFFLFVAFFKMWSSPILSMLTLILGILWSMGFVAVTIGELDAVTSMYVVILIGLGIDFGIHFLTNYSLYRRQGKGYKEAIQETFSKAGPGIFTGALTTAIVFFLLMILNLLGISDLGFDLGSGIIFLLIATFFVLPSFIAWTGKRALKKGKEPKLVSLEFKSLAKTGGLAAKFYPITLIITFLLTAFFLYQARNVKLAKDLLDFMPKNISSVFLSKNIEKKFHMSTDYALVTANSIEETEEITREMDNLKTVRSVSSIYYYLPSKKTQIKRRPYVEAIRKNLQTMPEVTPLKDTSIEPLIKELSRLNDNITEAADLSYIGGMDRLVDKCDEILGKQKIQNPITTLINHIQTEGNVLSNLSYFQEMFYREMKAQLFEMTNTEMITYDMLPENVKTVFTSNDGKHFLIYIFPKRDVWKEPFLSYFSNEVWRTNKNATGMSLAFTKMMGMVESGGKIAIIAAFIGVFLLLLVDFRNLNTSIFAMIPLVVGVIWTAGIMGLLGINFNLINFIAVPLIVGIGVDDGVHIIHRYRIEGKGSLRTVLSHTGKAILLTSLTTMAAFGSMMFARYQGFKTMGTILFVGIGVCFVLSAFVLPAILTLAEKRGWKI